MAIIERLKTALKELNAFLKRRFARIDEINRKYSNPRIKMTKMTRLTLLLLRIYLLLLVAILFYKFFTIIFEK